MESVSTDSEFIPFTFPYTWTLLNGGKLGIIQNLDHSPVRDWAEQEFHEAFWLNPGIKLKHVKIDGAETNDGILGNVLRSKTNFLEKMTIIDSFRFFLGENSPVFPQIRTLDVIRNYCCQTLFSPSGLNLSHNFPHLQTFIVDSGFCTSWEEITTTSSIPSVQNLILKTYLPESSARWSQLSEIFPNVVSLELIPNYWCRIVPLQQMLSSQLKRIKSLKLTLAYPLTHYLEFESCLTGFSWRDLLKNEERIINLCLGPKLPFGVLRGASILDLYGKFVLRIT